jgi:hypothetical protein
VQNKKASFAERMQFVVSNNNSVRILQTAFEDNYMTILDIDGPEWTDELRRKMHDSKREDNKEEFADEQSWLISSGSKDV